MSKTEIADLEFYWDTALKSGPETDELTKLVWPRFLIEQSDLAEAEVGFTASGENIFKYFAIWGLRRSDTQQLVAFANGVFIPADLESDTLPDDGWHFAMDTFGICASGDGLDPNTLCLLTANVHPDYREAGFSQILLETGKQIARQRGLKAMIGPVRPSHKTEFPELTMSDYLKKKSPTGEIFDPWLRTHVRAGARIVNVCSNSVVVKASLLKWAEWLGEKPKAQTHYPNTFAPLEIDPENGFAIYREPNVWVRYSF